MLKVIVIIAVFGEVFGANILFLSLLPAISHHVWNEAVIEALLLNGHNITLLGHSKNNLKLDNYTVLEIEGFHKSHEDDLYTTQLFKLNSIKNIFLLWDFNLEICEHDFKSDALQRLMGYSKNSFDLIIFDLNAGQCLYPLIDYFNSPPVVGVSPFGISPFVADSMGEHVYPYISFYALSYSDRMSSWQRLHNVVLQMMENIVKWCFYMPDFYRKAQQFFGEDIRCFHDVERSIGLLLTNNDPLLDFPQTFPPNIVPVGGLRVEPSNLLPNHLQELMDESDSGVIYFSLNLIKAKSLSEDVKKVFASVFSKLKQTVLWSIDEDNLNVSSNVIIQKHFPQNDILAHKNTKLFITHGDSLSIRESMYNGVPVVGIPLFGEQHGNVAKIVKRSLGKKLNYVNLNVRLVHDTISEVLHNPLYRSNMMELAEKFKNQKPSDRAAFWIEYALTNKNLTHLNVPANYMSFYQIFNVDVAFLGCICVCLFLYACHTIYQLIWHWVQMAKVKKKSGIKRKNL